MYLENNLCIINIAATLEVEYIFSIEVISTLHGLCFDIPVVQDDLVEDEECFEVAISLPNAVSGLMVEIESGNDTATVCIQDDDSKS